MNIHKASKVIQSRRMHVVSSANGASSAIKRVSNKQTQNRHLAAVLQDTSPLSSNIKTAKDIQVLLNNIGAATRASITQIEHLMQKYSNEENSQQVTASNVIDLIARVRSL